MGRNRLRRAAGALSLALAACGTPAVEPDAPALVAPRVVERDAGPPLFAWERCERCHVSIAAEHARSLHAQAATDPLYLREVALVPDRSFCDGCHGAENDPPGITCASCHVRDGVILATARSGRAPHPVEPEPALATDEGCAGCHQFDFPHRPGDRMQRTLDEASLLGEPRSSCLACHFESHDVRVSDERLAASLRVSVTARREGENVRARFVLRTGEVGHAVPTGDVFRRLELRAWIAGGSRRTATLMRETRPAPDGLHDVRDGRVLPGEPRSVELVLPARDGRRVRWEIEWLALPRATGERSTIPEGWWRRPLASGGATITE